MLKGHFRDVSVERIMRILTRLGCEVDIVVRAKGRKRSFQPIRMEPDLPSSLAPRRASKERDAGSTKPV
jgi:hypothetical protein